MLNPKGRYDYEYEKHFLLPVAGTSFGACSNKVYEKTGDSVIVKVQHKETGGPRLVRLQVMGDKLIHVSATADSKFADPQSLIVVPQKNKHLCRRAEWRYDYSVY